MTYLELKTEISEAIGETSLSIYEDRIEALLNDAFAEVITQNPALKNSDISEFITTKVYSGGTALTRQISEYAYITTALKILDMENTECPIIVERTPTEYKKALHNTIMQPTESETFYYIKDGAIFLYLGTAPTTQNIHTIRYIENPSAHTFDDSTEINISDVVLISVKNLTIAKLRQDFLME